MVRGLLSVCVTYNPKTHEHDPHTTAETTNNTDPFISTALHTLTHLCHLSSRSLAHGRQRD